jgi:hypothetical protein
MALIQTNVEKKHLWQGRGQFQYAEKYSGPLPFANDLTAAQLAASADEIRRMNLFAKWDSVVILQDNTMCLNLIEALLPN